ncbi:MAG: UDP-N-acetylglucosamine--N-acetylmuramyl-(pentapeptide) pyrophosphoryl-undecaprenol N-acetylglucosamine transferase [Patescibacteria group bacterium]|jgi:UDP-N-acetylglucosamine--N-acetylmuramyl-(pentapeptide) pyrophosphoryl-undecaprenol N-acetylglucosamine transferase
MKIILSGGGTIGSVTPLLAVAEKIKDADFLFVGTKTGPEKSLVEAKGIRFVSITSGKFRRYFSFNNFIDIAKIKYAFFQSISLIKKEKPDVIVSAGGFVSVPLVWAAFITRVPAVVHSQDIRTGLAVKLMKPFCQVATKAFIHTKLKAKAIGNPVRSLRARTNYFKLKNNKPVVLITGGGTGAMGINNLVQEDLCSFAQVIHVTGDNKNNKKIYNPDYHAYEFLRNEMPEALNKADVVITRAGLSTLTELCALSKPSIVIPMPNSHQEINAQYFSDHKAIFYLKQKELTPEKLTYAVKELLKNKDLMKTLAKNINKLNKPHAAEELAKIICAL